MRERRNGLWRPNGSTWGTRWLPLLMSLGLLTLTRAARAGEAVSLPEFRPQDTKLIWFVLASGIISVLMGIFWFQAVNKQSPGTPKMEEVGKAIRDGANAYLTQQIKAMSILVLVIA